MPATRVDVFGDPSRVWTVPLEDVSRQATASLRGYVYQLHASATAWVGLGIDDELYLEVAEDYTEILREPGTLDEVLRATQVKDTRESGSVTLNSADVLDAVEALHRLRITNPGRNVRLVFLTTSSIGQERRNALPSGVAGLTAWEAAASGGDVEELRAALLQRLHRHQLS
jgi:CheY-like chemotaxis protein